jgi:predicted component of type VI protein secretion system
MTTGGARGSEPAPTLQLDCDGSPVLVQAHDVVVGRVAKCTVRVTHPLVSREHCRFEPRADGLFVVDLGSQNGTWVNGERVNGRLQVRTGDKVGLGRDGAVLVVRSAVVGVIDVARLPREEDMRTMVAGDARARGVIAQVDVSPDAMPSLGAADEPATRQVPARDATAPTRQAAVSPTTAAQSAIPVATVLHSADHAAAADASRTAEVPRPGPAAPRGDGFRAGFAAGVLIGLGIAAVLAFTGALDPIRPRAHEAAPR